MFLLGGTWRHSVPTISAATHLSYVSCLTAFVARCFSETAAACPICDSREPVYSSAGEVPVAVAIDDSLVLDQLNACVRLTCAPFAVPRLRALQLHCLR